MRFLFFAVIVSYLLPLFAQDTCNIVIKKNNFDTQFYFRGQKLKPKEIIEVVQKIPEAKTEMQYARNYLFFGKIFGYSGGFCLGMPLGTYITGGTPNWKIFYLGLGLTAVSIPFQIKYNKLAKKAVNIYNQKKCADMNLKFTNKNVCITLNL